MNIREDAAKYYDTQSFPIDDVGYYQARVPSADARILELGCGTGRVLLPLARMCGHICGIDTSAAMLAHCAEKLRAACLPEGRARLIEGDASDVHLGKTFYMINAPFRVLQLLETDAHVASLMTAIREHLAPGGTAILNTFLPNREPEEMVRSWVVLGEEVIGESMREDGGRVVRLDRRPRIQADPLVIYPELIYRTFDASGVLTDESVLKIGMRCWYPADLEKLITDHGFHVTGRWGGYAGERWGEGPELVIEFGR